jgi:hypothetical protein
MYERAFEFQANLNQWNMSLDEYMQTRLDMTKKYTVPSLLNQGCKDFEWWIIISPQTPDRHRDMILDGIDDLTVRLIEFASDSLDELPIDLPNRQETVITRLDSDDMLSGNYVGAVNRFAEQVGNPPLVVEPHVVWRFNKDTTKMGPGYPTLVRKNKNPHFVPTVFSLVRAKGATLCPYRGSHIDFLQVCPTVVQLKQIAIGKIAHQTNWIENEERDSKRYRTYTQAKINQTLARFGVSNV